MKRMSNWDRKSWWILGVVLVLFIVVVAVWGTAAYPQGVTDVEPVAGETQDWMAFVQQIVLLLLSGLIFPALWAYMKKKGLDVEGHYRDQIQITAMRAAALILEPGLTPEQRKIRAMSYMATGAKDAIEAMKADPDRIWKIVESYYNQLTVSQAGSGYTQSSVHPSTSE